MRKLLVAIDYDAITSIVALVSAIFAIVALLVESRRSRIVRQTDLLLRLDEKFYGPENIKMRQNAAKKLLKEEFPNHELEDLLDSFSTVAMLVECKALDMDLTYLLFEYWIIRYWYSAQKYVRESRRFDPETWSTLERLVNKLVAERSKRGQPLPSEEELLRFLKEEARVRLQE